MKPILVNEQLLAESAYFNNDERKAELSEMFGFQRRRVLLGEGAVYNLGDECRRLNAKKVFLVRDPGIEALEQPVRWILDREGIEITGSFTDIVPNPRVAGVDALTSAVQAVPCDAVIAMGGGSTMDTAKVGLCVATCGGATADYFGFDLFDKPANWPLIAVPTTAGTGAEVSKVAVIVSEGVKQLVSSERIQPSVALVDPGLTRELPPALTATTALDALGHALECMASRKSNDIGDAVAREALLAGLPYMERAIAGGPDSSVARYQMSRCSLLAGMLLSPINTGAAHALGYGIEKVALAKSKPVPHGASVALVLPGVMRHNASQVAAKYYYAAGVAGLDLAGMSVEEGAELAADHVDSLRRRHTAFGSLTSAGLDEADIPEMVEVGMSVRRLLDHNPVEVSSEQAAAIYRAVLK
jgi:alcohol dehydrogenase class IV